LARRLTDRYRPIAVDLRAHGGTDVPPHPPGDYAFARMAADVLAVLDELRAPRWVALGGSLGGGVCSLVDAARPGATRAFLLCEAIAFRFPPLPVPAAPAGRDGSNPMAAAARNRRPVWPDRAAVLESYRARPPLDVLAPEALAAYVRWGFVSRVDGLVELACPPEAEAAIFEISGTDLGAGAAWDHLASLSAPAVVVAGTRSELPFEWFEAQADGAGAPMVAVDGGHFCLHEDTARAERLVRTHLA
jgi:pimeloyl-ACP methyl ester carboxylesterase